VAAERHAPFTQLGKDYFYADVSHSLESQTIQVWPAADQHLVDEYIDSGGLQEWEPLRLNIPLLGYHQVENAATAYVALQVFHDHALPVSDGAIRDGFARVFWPGRIEILQRYPPVVIDSAHNRDSALRLRLALDDYFPGYPVVMMFGASEDKDVKGMFDELLPRVHQVVATRSIHPRAMDPELLVELAHQHGRPAKIIDEIPTALEEAIRLASGEVLVLVTGSLFVAAGAREAWYARNGLSQVWLENKPIMGSKK
jgi:dihydrofolate synthase/folylpolyglutamate synthase